MSTKATRKPRLLWFDLSSTRSAAQCIQAFLPHCHIDQACGLDDLTAEADKPAPDMLCLQFDRPDSNGLNLLMEIKQRSPSLPITMLTVQHSEELAVWAFRSGVWEYLALPLSHAEFNRYLRSLRDLCEMRARPAGTQRQRPRRTERLPDCVRLNREQHVQQPLLAAITHIDSHFRERIDESDMAALCAMSTVRFSRLFKQYCGIGFQEYVTRKRMQAAEELLFNSDIPVSSVAYTVGFKDPSYFSRAFRQHFGRSPSACRTHRRQPPSQLDETSESADGEILQVS
ncbi:response regulator transcription factor [Pseudomonas oryzae]|uniref:Two component transcriptional regulator, AraC family n=1 Tax=Pseudomonas oryzae TaxID=1392877 RepID=A0A1H1Z868_9PSED|nr:response regulator transcription factor [Pseudomonas oryzae]SDT29386.1 two component transcriptional regulator, AraC family [Pseudomonas oryzae]